MTNRTTLSPEQKEQTRHGGHLFPFQKYITVLSDLYPAVTPHWHDEAELTLIKRGSCTYQIRLRPTRLNRATFCLYLRPRSTL